VLPRGPANMFLAVAPPHVGKTPHMLVVPRPRKSALRSSNLSSWWPVKVCAAATTRGRYTCGLQGKY